MKQSATIRIGKRIKHLRLDNKWTQASLAEALGCESMTVSRYERGEYAPSIEMLEQIARVLGVGLDAFFSNQDPAEPTTANLRHHLCDIAYQADEISLKEIVGAAKRILRNRVQEKYTDRSTQ